MIANWDASIQIATRTVLPFVKCMMLCDSKRISTYNMVQSLSIFQVEIGLCLIMMVQRDEYCNVVLHLKADIVDNMFEVQFWYQKTI